MGLFTTEFHFCIIFNSQNLLLINLTLYEMGYSHTATENCLECWSQFLFLAVTLNLFYLPSSLSLNGLLHICQNFKTVSLSRSSSRLYSCHQETADARTIEVFDEDKGDQLQHGCFQHAFWRAWRKWRLCNGEVWLNYIWCTQNKLNFDFLVQVGIRRRKKDSNAEW